MKLAERVSALEYPIRDIVALAKQVESEGRKVIYLNIGDPLKYDFDTPRHVKDALLEAVREGYNYYSASEGLEELRKAICEKERALNGIDITPGDVVVTYGVTEAIIMLAAALIDPGDELLVPGPCYPVYITFTRFFGGRPVFYRTVEEDGWRPDVDDIRKKVGERTKAIVVINPNNPTGAVYPPKVVKEVVDIAGERGIPVVSDEIYDRIVFDGEFRSTASLAKDVPVVGLNGFSKAYLMTGWRLGYAYFHDPGGRIAELREAFMRMARSRLSSVTPVQKAGVAALRGSQDHIAEMVEKLRRRRDLMLKRVEEIDGLSAAKPEGSFYMFIKVDGIGRAWRSDAEFAEKLLREEGVVVVRGSGFGAYGEGHFRAVFLPPPDVINEAMDRIGRFVRS